MMKLKTIRSKIIFFFGMTALLIMVFAGVVIEFTLGQSIAKQSKDLAADVMKHTYMTLAGQQRILVSSIDNLKIESAINADGLAKDAILKTIIESQMYDSLDGFLELQGVGDDLSILVSGEADRGGGGVAHEEVQRLEM